MFSSVKLSYYVQDSFLLKYSIESKAVHLCYAQAVLRDTGDKVSISRNSDPSQPFGFVCLLFSR